MTTATATNPWKNNLTTSEKAARAYERKVKALQQEIATYKYQLDNNEGVADTQERYDAAVAKLAKLEAE